jgi:hypothetical protein
MKKFFVCVFFVALLIGITWAQQATQTTALGFNRPVIGSTNWGALINANWSALDNYLSGAAPIPALVVSGTVNGNKSLMSTYATATNCGVNGAPANCGSAAAGAVVVAAASTTVVVNTSSVTASSEIFLQEDSSMGTRLSVTCNTTLGRSYVVTARTAATSFTITSSAAPATNPACLSYRVVN